MAPPDPTSFLAGFAWASLVYLVAEILVLRYLDAHIN